MVEYINWIQWIFSLLFVLTGIGFILIGAFGIIRLPDFYSRLHASGVIDTLGVELVIIGLMVHSGFSLITLKLALIGLLLFLTSPTSTHAIANAALKAGLKPLKGRWKAPEIDEIDEEESS